jgi:mono/diheme cytochrome c family protein
MKMNANATRTTIALFCTLALSSSLYAGEPSSNKQPSNEPVVHNTDIENMRAQGEQRYRANCGRCHTVPQKFPPRMMATVLRHMRVRATITDEDMRLVLFYMTR